MKNNYLTNLKPSFNRFSSFVFLFIIFTSLIGVKVIDTMNLLLLFILITFLAVREKVALTSDAKNWLLMVLFGFSLLGLLPSFFHSLDLISFKSAFTLQFIPFYAAAGVMYLLIKLKPTERVLWLSSLGASLGILLVVILEYLLFGNDFFDSNFRLGEVYGRSTLIFGAFSSILIGVFFGGLFWAIANNKKTEAILFVAAVLVSLYASFMAGTRGGWLGLPEIFIGWSIYAYTSYINKLALKLKLVVILVLFSISIIIGYLVGDKINHRIDSAVSNVQHYLNGEPNTSIGLRFTLYEAGVYSFQEHPIIGIGAKNVANVMEDKTKQIFKERFGLDRPGFDSGDVHNQYLQEAVTKGIFGLVSLLSIQVFLLFFFYRRLSLQNIWAIAGFIFVIASFLNLMSYSWLRFHGGMFFYFIIATILVYGASNPWLKTNSEESTGDSK